MKKGRKEKRNTTSLISFGRHYRSLIFRSYKRSYPTNPLSSFSLVFYVESFLRTDDRLRHFLLCPRDCTPQFPTEQDNKHQQYVIFRRISKSPHTVLTRLHHYWGKEKTPQVPNTDVSYSGKLRLFSVRSWHSSSVQPQSVYSQINELPCHSFSRIQREVKDRISIIVLISDGTSQHYS